jgi:hypothetical protein
MNIYWTLQVLDEPIEIGQGSPSSFVRWLYAKKLPHNGPADWMSEMLGNEGPGATTSYAFVSEGRHAWTLTWGEPQPGVHDIDTHR